MRKSLLTNRTPAAPGGLRPMRIFVAMLAAMLAMTTGLHAQTPTVTGKVTDTSGAPVVGVIVSIQGTGAGTTTGPDGAYSLQVSSGTVLEYYQFGYARVAETVASRSVINVVLTETAIDLEEVVVIGYGTMTKRDLTGSVSTVNAETLAKEQPQTVADLLRNNVPGLSMGLNTSAEGNTTDLVIRGKTNLRSESQTSGYNDSFNAPLIVLDDVIYYGRMTDINPNDIERVDVLKDSSSAAIYGAKASNGVIIITTKKGKQGKPMISLAATMGMSVLSRVTERWEGEEFLHFRGDARKYTSANSMSNYYDDPRQMSGQMLTDWLNGAAGDPVDVWLGRLGLSPSQQANFKSGNVTRMRDLLFDEVAVSQDYTLSVSGRTGETSYYTSIGYTDNKTNVKGSGFRSIKARLKLESKINKSVTYGANAQYTNQERGFVALPQSDVTLSPYAQYYNEDGSFKTYPDDTYVGNPLMDKPYTDYMDNTSILSATGFLKVALPYGFSVETRFSPYLSYNQYYYFQSSERPGWAGTQSNLVRRRNNNYFNYQWDNLLKWNKQYGEHSFDFTFLINWEKRQDWLNAFQGTDFSPNDMFGWHGMQWATTIVAEADRNVDRVRTSDAKMARIQYNYGGKYQVTASWRRDGDSEFGKANPRADFFSGALAWTFTEENFWPEIDWVSWGKLRLSYGENGNRQVGSNAALMTLASQKYVYILGGQPTEMNAFYANKMANHALRWEKTSSWNAALDISLLKDRISATVDVYKKVTNGLVMDKVVPVITGYSTIKSNVGEIQNTGIEVSVTSRNYMLKNFKWDTQLSYYHNKNRINALSLVDPKTGKPMDDIANRWFIGRSMHEIWDYEVLGTWKTTEAEEAAKYGGLRPGDFKLNKKDWSSTTYGNDDKKFLGSTEPLHRLSMRNTFTLWENLSVSVNMYSYLGFYKQFDHAMSPNQNNPATSTLKFPYWTEDNQRDDFSRISSKRVSGLRIWRRADFLKVDNISVGYQVPSKYLDRFKIHALNVNVSLKNGMLLSKWPGQDPETDRNDAYRMDYSPRYVYFGLNLTF